jgi:hypothetical protein
MDAIESAECLAYASEPHELFHVCQIHKLVMTNIDNDEARQFRKTQVLISWCSIYGPSRGKLRDRWMSGDVGSRNQKYPHNLLD